MCTKQCVCVCVCVCARARTRMCAHMHVHVCACMRVCVHVCVCVPVHLFSGGSQAQPLPGEIPHTWLRTASASDFMASVCRSGAQSSARQEKGL